jgi:hypothetical protein
MVANITTQNSQRKYIWKDNMLDNMLDITTRKQTRMYFKYIHSEIAFSRYVYNSVVYV